MSGGSIYLSVYSLYTGRSRQALEGRWMNEGEKEGRRVMGNKSNGTYGCLYCRLVTFRTQNKIYIWSENRLETRKKGLKKNSSIIMTYL